MTARETLERHARRMPGGLAWERRIFLSGRYGAPAELIDAAVDIAWECLGSDNPEDHPSLDICERGDLLVIRVPGSGVQTELPLAA